MKKEYDIFILAALAGVRCRVGRESREEYDEPHAGHRCLHLQLPESSIPSLPESI